MYTLLVAAKQTHCETNQQHVVSLLHTHSWQPNEVALLQIHLLCWYLLPSSRTLWDIRRLQHWDKKENFTCNCPSICQSHSLLDCKPFYLLVHHPSVCLSICFFLFDHLSIMQSFLGLVCWLCISQVQSVTLLSQAVPWTFLHTAVLFRWQLLIRTQNLTD